MTPADYVAIARRHWKLIVALVVLGVAVVFWTSPEKSRGTFEATHVLRVETEAGRNAETDVNPGIVAEYVKTDAVAERVAAAMGFDGDPSQLKDKVTAEPDRTIGVVRITATDKDRDRAAVIANTFASEVEGYVTEAEVADQQAAAAALQAREDQVRARIAALDAQLAAVPTDATAASERDGLLRQLNDIESQQSSASAAPTPFSTVQAATRGVERDPLPGTRSREQRMLLVGLVALLLGFGLAVALDRSDTRIRQRRTAEAHFGARVLAEVPTFNLPARRRKLVVVEEPDSVRAEAFRTLRTAIMLVRPPDHAERGNGHQEASHLPKRASRSVIMITSAGPGEGKTTTAANLAAAYAESGSSVLVLSCDLWRSSVARHFGIKLGRGVSDFLAADDDPPLSGYVHDTDVAGVSLVSAGLALRRAGGRLQAEQRLIDEARRTADVVIVDTAPVLSAALTRELATMVDAVVVVCRVGKTPAGEAERCADLLGQLGAPVLGLALVGVATPPFYDYFSYASPRRARREVARAQADAGRAGENGGPPGAPEAPAAPGAPGAPDVPVAPVTRSYPDPTKRP